MKKNGSEELSEGDEKTEIKSDAKFLGKSVTTHCNNLSQQV